MKKGEDGYQPIHRLPTLNDVLANYSDQILGVHPACEAIPSISPLDFDNLVASIQAHGLLDPVLVDPRGNLLDGRSRLSACHVLRLTVRPDQIVTTHQDPKAIADSNYARRHLTNDQKAIRALNSLDVEAKIAKQKKRRGAEKGRARHKNPLVTKAASSKQPAKRVARTIETVAKKEGVSRDKLTIAKKVRDSAPDLAAKVGTGELTLHNAAERAGVAKAKKRNRPPTKKKSKAQSETRPNGIRIEQCENATMFHHPKLGLRIITFALNGQWHLLIGNEDEYETVSSRQEANEVALDKMDDSVEQLEVTLNNSRVDN